MRQKSLITKEQKKQLKIASIVQEVRGFINKNEETYVIVASTDDFFIITKKKELQIYSKNTNNIFQPRESIDKRVINSTFVLTFENKKSILIDALKKIECPVINILEEKDIEKLLSDI